MRKKLIAFVMAVMVTFTVTGCNEPKDEGTVTYKGRYVEEEVSLPGQSGLFGELFLYDGAAAFFDYGTDELCQLNDDKTGFSKSALPDIGSLGTDLSILCEVCSSDGTYFFSYYNFSVSDEIQYGAITANGEISSFSLDGTYLQMIEFSPDGRLFAYGATGSDFGVYEIDIQRQSIKSLFYANDVACAFDVVGDYIVAVDSSEMYFYDYKNETITDTPKAMQDFLSEQGLSSGGLEHITYNFCSGEEDSFYIVSKKGLYRYAMGGNLVEQLVDGYSCRLGNPSYTVSSVIREEDGSFLISYEEGVIMRYCYDPDAVNEITSTLKVYSLTENDVLSRIISEYKVQNPTVRVDYEIGMRSGMTYDDALKNLTTEILSDNAPDVMMLDGLDIDNYIEKNMLFNLTECENVWNPDNVLLDNVAKWNGNDGGLYSVACKFELPVVIGRQEDMERISSFSDFADIVEEKDTENSDGYIVEMYSPNEILEAALRFANDELMQGNTSSLLDMLSNCKRIYDCESKRHSENDLLFYDSVFGDEVNYKTWHKSTNMLWGYTKIVFGNSNGFNLDVNVISSLNSIEPNITYRFGFDEEDKKFTPVCNLGICTSSSNVEAAIGFIQIALSDNVQAVELNDGFPVNKIALQKLCNDNDYVRYMYGLDCEDFTVKKMDSAEADEFQNHIENLDTPIYIDTMMHDMIIDVGTKCLESSLTPEEAVNEITRQLDLRMKE